MTLWSLAHTIWFTLARVYQGLIYQVSCVDIPPTDSSGRVGSSRHDIKPFRGNSNSLGTLGGNKGDTEMEANSH